MAPLLCRMVRGKSRFSSLFADSAHPPAARRLRAELEEVLGGRIPSVEDVPRLDYTTRMIHEALRLYPPLWAVSRRVREEAEVGGYTVPAGEVPMRVRAL